VVAVVSVWQNIPCRVQRQHVVHHLHRLLRAVRLSTGPTGSTVVHCLHSGPCSYSGKARRISTRVCRRHAAVSTLSSHRHGVCCCTAGTVITDVGRWMCANRLKLNADKTELLWVGSRHSLSQQDSCLPVLQLGSDSIVARDHVRLLGVTLSSDLSFDRHVSIVSASSFYWLRQLQRSRRSLDTESAPTLVHSFVASRIDYCNAVLVGVPKATTNKLQRVLNAAARVVSGTHKFDRGLSRLLHT